MQKLISKYWLAAHLALLAVAPLFLFPFFGADDTATVLLWLTLWGWLWIFLEPSRRGGEMLHNARVRVVGAIVRDPVFWLLFLLLIVSVARWVNCGPGLAVNSYTNKYCISNPPVGWLPGSIKGSGFLWFSVVFALMCVVTGCRNALGKSARLSFVFTSSFLAGVAAIVALCTCRAGNEVVLTALQCGFDVHSYVGTAFGLYALGGLVALCGSFEQRWNKLLLLFSLSIGANASGLVYFAPVHVVLAFAVAAILLILGCGAYIAMTQRKSYVLKYLVGVIVAVMVPVVLGVCVLPPDVTEAKLTAFKNLVIFPEHFFEARSELAKVAIGAWRGNLWFGTGEGYFPLELRFAAAEGEWWYEDWWGVWRNAIPVSALNGWLQIISERGIVGVATLTLPVVFILVTFVMRLIGAWGRRVFFPLCGLGLVAVLVVAAEGVFDGAPTRPDVILAVGSFLALSASAFPAFRRSGEESTD